jgi:hypothetical protein
VVPDVETCDFMAGTADLDEYRRSNIRAVQSTPLVSRSGQLLGMISTHWRESSHSWLAICRGTPPRHITNPTTQPFVSCERILLVDHDKAGVV